jgi:hypothetical protein
VALSLLNNVEFNPWGLRKCLHNFFRMLGAVSIRGGMFGRCIWCLSLGYFKVSVSVIITCLLSIVPVLLRMPYLFAKQSTRDVGLTVSLPLLLPLPLPLTNKSCPT